MLPAAAHCLEAPSGPLGPPVGCDPHSEKLQIGVAGEHQRRNPAQQCPAAGGGPGLRHAQKTDCKKTSFSLHRCVFSSHLDFKFKRSLPGKSGEM